jgi:hypothetical protein
MLFNAILRNWLIFCLHRCREARQLNAACAEAPLQAMRRFAVIPWYATSSKTARSGAEIREIKPLKACGRLVAVAHHGRTVMGGGVSECRKNRALDVPQRSAAQVYVPMGEPIVHLYDAVCILKMLDSACIRSISLCPIHQHGLHMQQHAWLERPAESGIKKVSRISLGSAKHLCSYTVQPLFLRWTEVVRGAPWLTV